MPTLQRRYAHTSGETTPHFGKYKPTLYERQIARKNKTSNGTFQTSLFCEENIIFAKVKYTK